MPDHSPSLLLLHSPQGIFPGDLLEEEPALKEGSGAH